MANHFTKGRPKTFRPMLSVPLSVCPVLSCPVCDIGVLWPNSWMDQDETWQGGRPRPWPHCVRWEPSSPTANGNSPQLLAHVCCGQMAGWIKMPLCIEVGLNPGDFVLNENPAPLPKKGPMSVVAKCLDGSRIYLVWR